MRPLARHLDQAGFDVSFLAYPTVFASFARAVDIARVAAATSSTAPLHLVGYSFGGLVMRALAAEAPPGLISVLLIGVPNSGSRLADLACRFTPTPALRRMSTTAPPLPEAGHVRVGCIAGARAGPLGILVGSPSDGRVSVESALGIKHHAARILPVGHKALMFSEETAHLTLRFLTTGGF